jgi:hypothetical protein
MSAIETSDKLIAEWQPGDLPTELKYRDSLARFFRDRLKDKATVETECRHNGTTIDFHLKQSGFFGSSEVFIELKRNLVSKTSLDRLVGQVESLDPKKNCVIVIFCGETNPALVMRFKEKYKNVIWKDLFGNMPVVLKEPASAKKD